MSASQSKTAFGKQIPNFYIFSFFKINFYISDSPAELVPILNSIFALKLGCWGVALHGRCDGIKVEIVRVKKVSPKQAGHCFRAKMGALY